MHRNRLFAVVLTLAVAIVLVPSAHAQTAPQEGTPLEFIVAPYLLFPTMSGDVALNGRDISVDLGPGEIFENLEFGIMGYFQVRKGPWGFALDGLYMDLKKSASLDTPFGPLGLTLGMTQGMYEFSGLYAIKPWADLVFGARVNRITGSFTSPQASASLLEDGKTWVDPFIGTQLTVPDIGNWLVGLRVDIGGFGVGSSFAWQVYPTVGYEFVHWFTLAGGYRALSMDYEDGEGDERFAYDMTIFGPFVGGLFRF